jgi:hypothetical protein
MDKAEIIFLFKLALVPICFAVFLWLLVKLAKLSYSFLSKVEANNKSQATELLPQFMDLDSVKNTAKSCGHLFLFLGFVSVFLSMRGNISDDIHGVYIGAVFFMIGLGVRLLSRFAAVLGLFVSLSALMKYFYPLSSAIWILVLLISINSIKATFAFHRLRNASQKK